MSRGLGDVYKRQLPHSLMDRAAQMAQGFMRLEEPGHTVHYFSLANLQGAVVSIGIGAVVYLLFVRKVLMRPVTETGVENTAMHVKNVDKPSEIRRYVDIWPTWLDLENTVYRPVFLHYLPAVLNLICRIADTFIDLLIVGLRKTIYRDSPLPHERPEGNVLTEILGSILNLWQALGNHTWNRKDQKHRDYVHAFAIKNDEIKENHMVIGRSLSFGLLLVCIGICLTLIYIILW